MNNGRKECVYQEGERYRVVQQAYRFRIKFPAGQQCLEAASNLTTTTGELLYSGDVCLINQIDVSLT